MYKYTCKMIWGKFSQGALLACCCWMSGSKKILSKQQNTYLEKSRDQFIIWRGYMPTGAEAYAYG